MHYLSEMTMLALTLLVFPSVGILLLGLNLFWTHLKDPILHLLESPPVSLTIFGIILLTVAICYLCYNKMNKVALTREFDKLPVKDSLITVKKIEAEKDELMLNNIKNWK